MKDKHQTFLIPKGVQTPWKPATEQEVKDLERQLGRTLPDDYRRFLLTVNGIEAENSELVAQFHESTGMGVAPLVELCTVSRDASEISQVLPSQKNWRFYERVPQKYLFIGSDTMVVSGYCISLEGENCGYVYHWSPEDRTVDVDLDTEDYLTLMAKSFKEFWAGARHKRSGDFV